MGAGSSNPVRPRLTRLSDLVAARIASGDAYAGRRAPGRKPLVTFQLDYAEETPLYLGLDRGDLRRYAEALRRCLGLLDPRPGDVLAIFDYGTSPVAYLASATYTAYLGQGAADAFGCTTICNDGVTQMSHRAVEILKYARPRFFFLRPECLQPFLAACEAAGVQASRYTEALVATHNEGTIDAGLLARCQERLGLPLYQLARSDAALFMAMECPECRLLHTWPDLYRVEVVSPDTLRPVAGGQPGLLVITSRFARVCPARRLLTRLEGRLVAPGCPSRPGDVRLRL